MTAFTTERERDLYQARAFRLRGSPFAATMLEWAGSARRRAMLNQPEQVQHDLRIQGDLFA